jgi:uncharacterized membrane protein YvlD (DUF360 family)
MLIDFYRTQLRIAFRWDHGWAGLARRGVATFVIALVSLGVAVWILPGFRIRDITLTLAAVALLAVLRTLARPALIGLLASVPIIAATLLMVVAQAGALWLIAIVGALVIDRPIDALGASIIFSIANALLTAVLSTGDDNSFFGTLVRQLAARHRGRGSGEPGVVFVQIDGLSHRLVEREIAAGRMPTLARWSRSGAMTLDRWAPLLPTQTSASQAGVLHGNSDGIPGFRWWDKRTGRLMVSNHPDDAREMQRRVSDGQGLLADGGASIGNLFSGDAPRSFLTAATIDDPGHEIRRSHVLDWFFISPYSYVRWTLLSIGEIAKEIVQARRAGGRQPRSFPYPLARAATNVLLRHLTTALVIEEMWRGASRIYVDFVDYDEIAHHAGPDSVEARDAIAGLDKIVGIIERAAADAPRRYRFVVLSDHGQSPGAPFAQRFAKSLEELVRELAGAQVSVKGATAHAEHWGRVAPMATDAVRIAGVSRFVSGPHRRSAGASDGEKTADIVVAGSGNLAHVSFTAIRGRATRAAIDKAHPGLIDGLARHPGIGLVMVRDDDGSVVLGPGGARRLGADRAEGPDPLALFGDDAGRGLARVDAMDECGDLVVVSCVDAASGEVAPFEEQIGSHGGLGGEQNDAFVIRPAEWRLDGAIVGAVALHEQLERWLGGAADGRRSSKAG